MPTSAAELVGEVGEVVGRDVEVVGGAAVLGLRRPVLAGPGDEGGAEALGALPRRGRRCGPRPSGRPPAAGRGSRRCAGRPRAGACRRARPRRRGSRPTAARRGARG